MKSEVSRARLSPGIAAALAAAALFGLSAPFAKVLLTGASPQLLAGLLYLGSGTGLGLFWLTRRRGQRGAKLSAQDVPSFSAAIFFGGILGPLLLMLGLARTPASGASLLLNLEAVFTATLAWFVFRENFDRRIAIGMLLIVAGGAVLAWEGRVSWGGLLGPLAVAGACLCWGIDNNFTQRVSAVDPVQIAMIKGMVAGTVNTVLAIVLGAKWPEPSRVSLAMLLGFLSYGVSLVLFVSALRQLGTARTGAYFSVAPFVGAAISLVLLREQPTVLLMLAGALMASGVWLHVTERHEHEHVHEVLEHEHLHYHDEHHQHEHSEGEPTQEPHSHRHKHETTQHSHPHYPDIHHRHDHD